MSLATVLQFEKHLETGFIELLSGACQHIYGSLSSELAESPRVTVRATVGEINGNHEHVFEDGGADEGGHFRSAYDAYNASVECIIETNRITEEKSDAHYSLIGEVRAKMQRDYAVLNWNQGNPIAINTDLREVGSIRAVNDEKTIDSTTITFTFVFNVKPESWPANFN